MLSPIARRVTSGRLRLEGAFGTRSAPGCRAWPLDHQIGYLSVDDVHVPVSAPRELRIVRDQNDRRAHVIDLLEQINDMGTTIVLVTHDPELARRAHRNVHIVDGQVSDLMIQGP